MDVPLYTHFPLKNFDVSIAPNEEPRILRIENAVNEPELWCLKALMSAHGFTGAIAVRANKEDVLSAVGRLKVQEKTRK